MRLIVDNAAKGKEELTKNGFSSLLSDVSVIEITHKVGSLQELLSTVDSKGVSIEYMYGLSIEADRAYVVLKASDAEKIESILEQCGVHTLSCEELSAISKQ